MSDETVYESKTNRSRRAIATYLRRVATALDGGKPVPVDDDQTVTMTPAAESEMAVAIEQEADTVSLDIEVEWEGDADDVDTETNVSKARFEQYEDADDKWRWRLVHRNGNIIADSGEGYASAQKAEQGLESVRRNAPGGYVVDTSKADEEPVDDGGSNATFELFADKGGKWRWRLVHDNGNIIADSGQGYASKQKAKQGLRSVKTNVRGAPVERADGTGR